MGHEAEGKGLGVISRVSDVKFKNFVRPGDVLSMKITLTERLENAFYMSGRTRVNGKVVMQIQFTGALVSGA